MPTERPTVPAPPSVSSPDTRGAYDRALDLMRQDDYLGAVVGIDAWFRAAVRGVSPAAVRRLSRVPASRRVTALYDLVEAAR